MYTNIVSTLFSRIFSVKLIYCTHPLSVLTPLPFLSMTSPVRNGDCAMHAVCFQLPGTTATCSCLDQYIGNAYTTCQARSYDQSLNAAMTLYYNNSLGSLNIPDFVLSLQSAVTLAVNTTVERVTNATVLVQSQRRGVSIFTFSWIYLLPNQDTDLTVSQMVAILVKQG